MPDDQHRKPSSLLARLLRWPALHPWQTLAAAALLLGLSALSTSRLRLDPRLESLLPRGAAGTEALADLTRDFHLLDEAILLVELPPAATPADPPLTDTDHEPDADADVSRLLAYAQRFETRVRAAGDAAQLIDDVAYRAGPQVQRFVRDVAVPSAALYLDDDAFNALLNRLTPLSMRQQMIRNEQLMAAASPGAAQLARQIVRDPLRLHEIIAPSLAAMRPGVRTWQGGDAFIAPDGRALLIRITARGAATDMAFTRRLMALIEDAAAAAEPGDLRLRFAGSFAIARFSEAQIRGNVIASVTGSIVLMQLLFLLAYRRLLSFPLAIIPVAAGVLAAFGAYSAMFAAISPLTAGIGAILAGLGIDYSVHFLSHYAARRADGLSAVEAATPQPALARAMLYACGTSVIGFLAIAASSVPALRDFAILGALGIAGALLATLTLLPALLVIIDRRAPARPPAGQRLGPALLIAKFQHRPRLWLVGLAVVLLVAAIIPLRFDPARLLDADLRAMHPQPNEPLQTQDRIAAKFNLSPDAMLVHLTAASPAQLMERAASLRSRLMDPAPSALGIRVIGPAAFVPAPSIAAARLQQLQAIDPRQVIDDFRAAVEASPFRPDGFRAYEDFLRRLLRPTVPDLATLAAYPVIARIMLPAAAYERGRPATQALASIQLASPPVDRAAFEAAIDAVRTAIDDVPGTRLTGLSVAGSDLQRAVREELPRVALIAAAVVVGWVLLIFRRPVMVALALTPALAAAIFLLAALQAAGVGLNIINMAAIPILFGAAVDNGIYLVGAAGRAADEPLPAALAHRCHAITVCNLTTIFGFGALMLASVPAIQSLGLVLAAGMTGCWFASLFIVAPLLSRRDDRAKATALDA